MFNVDIYNVALFPEFSMNNVLTELKRNEIQY